MHIERINQKKKLNNLEGITDVKQTNVKSTVTKLQVIIADYYIFSFLYKIDHQDGNKKKMNYK